jgi:translation initiation factor 3 subunit D
LAGEAAAQVFATDSILTTLMCIKSSKYSWDLVVTKQGGRVFFDKRANSNLNYLTVNETAPEEVPEDRDNINGVLQLSIEATSINQNFSQQVGGPGGTQGAGAVAAGDGMVVVLAAEQEC